MQSQIAIWMPSHRRPVLIAVLSVKPRPRRLGGNTLTKSVLLPRGGLEGGGDLQDLRP